MAEYGHPNVAGNCSAPSCYALDSAALTIDHSPVTHVDDVDDRREGVQKLLER